MDFITFSRWIWSRTISPFGQPALSGVGCPLPQLVGKELPYRYSQKDKSLFPKSQARAELLHLVFKGLEAFVRAEVPPADFLKRCIDQYDLLHDAVSNYVIWTVVPSYGTFSFTNPSASFEKNSVATFKDNYYFLRSCGFTPSVRFPLWLFGGFELSLILGANIRGQDKNYPDSLGKKNYLEFLTTLPEHFTAFKQDMIQYRSYINTWWHLCGAETLLTKAGHPVSMPVGDSCSLISKMLSRGFTNNLPQLPAPPFDEIVDSFEVIGNFNEDWISPQNSKPLKFTDLGEFTPLELRSLAHKRGLERGCSPVPLSAPKRSLRI